MGQLGTPWIRIQRADRTESRTFHSGSLRRRDPDSAQRNVRRTRDTPAGHTCIAPDRRHHDTSSMSSVRAAQPWRLPAQWHAGRYESSVLTNSELPPPRSPRPFDRKEKPHRPTRRRKQLREPRRVRPSSDATSLSHPHIVPSPCRENSEQVTASAVLRIQPPHSTRPLNRPESVTEVGHRHRLRTSSRVVRGVTL